ncbi:beta-galactosidase [Alkalimarinus alittae]|uniref:Beta-galactosidase n=1 Tax=Alkalimarinus alittae TaxID=2961619 RepID=A0ABY6MZ55_9ALTE|nr:beta-galactosidase [Alkalimarinus alittae]UZE95126.1 beta-galactosidase [Alkalimarinus alittae]
MLIKELKLLLITLIVLALTACAENKNSSVEQVKKTDFENRSPTLNRINEPLLIAPMIEGIHYCDAPQHLVGVNKETPHYKYCANNEFSMIKQLKDLLNSLEPNGPEGKVQVGYTYGIAVLGLYDKTPDGWTLNKDKITRIFNNIQLVGRPTVVYFLMNHFDTASELSKELSNDKQNLMQLANGEPPIEVYFQAPIIPYTLSVDETIPVNKYRFEALRALISHYSTLPEEQQKLIHSFTLAGEIHHMFEDFQGGMGKFDDIKLTDYSKHSKQEFRYWLAEKYATLDHLNSELLTAFPSWEAVEPPSKNIRTEALDGFYQHVDSYSHGMLPIFGWLWDKNSNNVRNIKIYLNGEYLGNADQNLNRLDVYQAISDLDTPNVGFRYELDFSALEPGIHDIQVVADTTEGEYEMARQKFAYINREQDQPKKIKPVNKIKSLAPASSLDSVRYYVDHPKPLIDVYYNPLAKQWHLYRESQVERFITYTWKEALALGAEQEKLYSHQIPTYLNSSWNTVLFATGQSMRTESKYLPGITLYGGGADGDITKQIYPAMKSRKYGVPEYHSQQYKSYEPSYNALMTHYYGNADFVSPYYMSVVPDDIHQGDEAHKKFLIKEGNANYGSEYLYKAIQEIARD